VSKKTLETRVAALEAQRPKLEQVIVTLSSVDAEYNDKPDGWQEAEEAAAIAANPGKEVVFLIVKYDKNWRKGEDHAEGGTP
jgi:hypothetical protein